MTFHPSHVVLRDRKAKNLNNSRELTREFTEIVEIKRKKLWGSKILLTVNNQYINDFMKKLILCIKTKKLRNQIREVRGLA